MARSLIPNSTQIPDIILDHWMCELSGAEFKVLMYVARRTFGFGKQADKISLNQIAQGLKKRDGTILDRGVGSSRSSVSRSLKVLEDLKIILRVNHLRENTQEFEENTYRINLDWTPEDINPERKSNDFEVVSKCDHPHSESQNRWSQSETTWSQTENTGGLNLKPQVVSNWYIQETGETVQETAAAPASNQAPAKPNDADTEIFLELVRQGVSRKVAERLAREKPDVCKLCLRYLPFAKVRTTPGAWLANAIEQEFGAPEAFLKFEKEQKRKIEFQTQDKTNAKTVDDERESIIRKRLIVTLDQLSKTQPEAFYAFEQFLETERKQAQGFANMLSDETKTKYLESLNGEEFRIQQFEAWLKTEGRKFKNQASEAKPSFALAG